MIRFGDRIKALPNTVTAIFAEGRAGTVVGTPIGGGWLVQWEGDSIFMGFHPENVVRIKL